MIDLRMLIRIYESPLHVQPVIHSRLNIKDLEFTGKQLEQLPELKKDGWIVTDQYLIGLTAKAVELVVHYRTNGMHPGKLKKKVRKIYPIVWVEHFDEMIQAEEHQLVYDYPHQTTYRIYRNLKTGKFFRKKADV